MKNTSVKKIFNDFTHSEWVVYILLIISVINVITYLHQNNLSAIAIFLAIGFIISRYTKNMIYVLLSAIVITNLFVSMGYLNSLGQKTKTREGMAGRGAAAALNAAQAENTSTQSNSRIKLGDIESASSVGVKDLLTLNSPEGIVKEAVPDLSTPDAVEDSNKKNGGAKTTGKSLKEDKKDNKEQQANQEAFAEQMQPFLQQLQKMMGEGGFDMKQLKKQQDDLLNAMQQMKPIIDGAEGMINKVAGGPLGNLLGFKNKN